MKRPALRVSKRELRKRQSGFTLLEVLVALTILSLSIAALFGILLQTLDRGRTDRLSMQARVLAEAVLSEAKSSPPAADRSGAGPSAMRWRLHVVQLAQSGETERGAHAVALSVTVQWMIGDQGMSLTLSTLAFAPGEPGA